MLARPGQFERLANRRQKIAACEFDRRVRADLAFDAGIDAALVIHPLAGHAEPIPSILKIPSILFPIPTNQSNLNP
jgi:hypothetical protein